MYWCAPTREQNCPTHLAYKLQQKNTLHYTAFTQDYTNQYSNILANHGNSSARNSFDCLLLIQFPIQVWHGHLSGARCRFAYGPEDATASLQLTVSCSSKIQIGFTFLVPSTSYCIHFFTLSLSSFHNTCPYQCNLFSCSTEIMSSNRSLSLNPLLVVLSYKIEFQVKGGERD